MVRAARRAGAAGLSQRLGAWTAAGRESRLRRCAGSAH